MLYKVVLTFKSVGETIVCDHSNESYRTILSCGTIGYSNFNLALLGVKWLVSIVWPGLMRVEENSGATLKNSGVTLKNSGATLKNSGVTGHWSK